MWPTPVRRPLADRGSPGRTHGNAVANPRIRVCRPSSERPRPRPCATSVLALRRGPGGGRRLTSEGVDDEHQSCPACRAGRSTAAPPRPRACPSSAARCRRPARPGPGPAPASRGARRPRTAASRAASSQAALATKWCKDWCAAPDPGRVDPRRHRLDALALARQQQARGVGPQRARAGRRGPARHPAARRSPRTAPPSPPSSTPPRCFTARGLIWGRASDTVVLGAQPIAAAASAAPSAIH